MPATGTVEEDVHDLVIIGAGIYGIQAARTYLELCPLRKVVLLEASACIGGVWSRERVYDEFFTQTPIGILEFSDQRMHDISQADQHYGFFQAEHVVKYLEEYCRSHVYDDLSITSRIRFQTTVYKVVKNEDRRCWIVSGRDSNGDTEIMATHLIDASGLTSSPNMPTLPHRDLFKGRILHHKDFAAFEKDLAGTATSRVAVIGGAKSAADVAYSCAKKGHAVTWIVRKSGSGPAAFVSVKGSMGYANSNESFYTRFTSLFLASLFARSSGYTKFLDWLHKTSIGQRLVQRIWGTINTKAHSTANYSRSDGRKNGFSNLTPDTELFWQNDSTGINQREDFFDVIARQVQVYREDIACLSEGGIVLNDAQSTTVKADVIICATGWENRPAYFDAQTSDSLGLPGCADGNTREGVDDDKLEDPAAKDVLEQFPILDSPWAHSQSGWRREDSKASKPWRLWKAIIPPTDPTVAFVGRVMLGNHFRAAEVQALFACAVLNGQLVRPSQDDMHADIAKTLAWCRRRYLKKGRSGNWFYWDLVPYTDMLLETLGLSSHRHQAWYQDLFSSCFAKDLKELIREFREKHGMNL